MRSAQGVNSIREYDNTAVAFVDFLHTRGTAMLRATREPRAPKFDVLLMEGAKSHMAKTVSAVGVFKPVSHVLTLGKAKHVFPAFTIRFLEEHFFTNLAETVETLTQRDYEGHFH